jgi:hypothetical protein
MKQKSRYIIALLVNIRIGKICVLIVNIHFQRKKTKDSFQKDDYNMREKIRKERFP